MTLIGLIPAAGNASRFQGLPKFLFPMAHGHLLGLLCDRLRAGGTDRLLIGANAHNYTLLGHYAPRDAAIYTVDTKTMSETVLAALPHLGSKIDVLFGMPDTYWADLDVYPRLAECLRAGALVAMALFQTRPGQHRTIGMVDAVFDDDDLIVRRVVDKPMLTDLYLGWGALAWSPDFWRYIYPTDAHVGFAVQRALQDGIRVPGVLARGEYWDVGTPEGYYECVRQVTERMKA